MTEVPEDELVRWLFDECPVRHQVFQELEISGPMCVHRKVSQKDLSLDGGPGDVDLLLVPYDNPAHATAIECKRVKYQASVVSTGMKSPNKLGDLPHGAHQANLLLKAGFHRVYLLVVIKVDARMHPAANLLTRTLSSGQALFVHSTLSSLDLRPEVGVLCLELTQPSSRSFRDCAGVGLGFSVKSILQTQPERLTHVLKPL